MSVELGNAYISVSVETRGIPAQLRGALNSGAAGGVAAGSTAGANFASGLKKAIAAAGIAKVFTSAVTAGMNRLNTLEKADIQFRNMGLSAAQTKKQLADLNDIVTGTSTSLSDAAGTAAMLGQAGVKSGADLNNAVKALVNLSAASGTSAKDIGLVMMQIKASGKLMGSEALQLAQRGVPIYDLVAKSIGKTTAEVRKMGEAGKISFEQVVKAINDGTGNLAKEMGSTIPAQFANLKTALARASAEGLKPFFEDGKQALGGLTDLINKATPTIGKLSAALHDKIFDDWGPKLQAVMEPAKSTLKGMAQAGVDLLPALTGIGKALAEASARIGVGTWELFLATLQAATGALNIVNPALGMLADFMRAQPGLVTAALAAWVGFKTIPSMMSRVVSAVSPLSSALSTTGSAARTAGTGLMGLVRANGQLVATSRTSFVEMGRFGSMIGQVGTHVPMIGRMQSAFMGAAAGAERFGRTAGTFAAARTAMQGVGNAAGGLVNALGGPLNASLIGITAVGGALVSSFQRQNSIMAEQDAATKKLTESYYELSAAMQKSRGEATDEVMSIANRRIEQYREGVDAAARADGKWHEVMYDGIGKTLGLVKAGEGLAETHDRQAAVAQEAQRVYDELGMSTEDVGKKVYGSAVDWAYFAKRLGEMGPAGQKVRSDLNGLRVEFLNQQRIAKALTPGISEATEAIRMLGDNSVSSADKMNALKTAMNALNPTRNEAEAMKQWGDQVRSAADAAAGIDSSAFDMKGKLDSSSEAGGKLLEVLGGLADTAATVASAGGDMTKVAREQDQIFERLAASTGKTKEEIKALYDSIGGNVVDIAVALKGKPEVIQQLGAIKAAMDANPSLKEFQLKAEGSEQVQYALKQLGIEFKKTPDGKLIKVDLTGDAGQKLRNVIAAASQIPPGKQIKVDAPGGQAVYGLLQAMGVEVRTNNDKTITADIPNGSPVLQLLRDIGYEVETRNGKSIIVKADDTDYQKKKPGWIEDDYKTIWVTGVPRTNSIGMQQDMLGNPIFTPPRADGGIVDAFANGGLKQIEKPNRADIFAGRGAGTIFAEKETGGEAYIPLAESKRRRSTDILATVANMFGLALVPQNSISATFGDLASRAVSSLFKKAGSDNITRYADGGIALRELAEGKGASQPLKGAPYRWGQVNWGDCSGAMSAFARFAVGLDPFGGRFATANEGDYLAKLGFKPGRGNTGDLRIGWVNGGPGGGHTAGTLPDGTNIEMGGSYGGGMVGGTVGSNDGQFTNQMFLPVGAATPDVPAYQRPGDEYNPDPNYQPGQNGNYPNGSTGSTSGNTSISGRFGAAAGAFVEGQLADIFKTLYINDTPGVLGAIAEYENSQRNGKSPTSPGDTAASKREYEEAKLKSKQDFEAEKLKRKQEYDSEKARLKAELDAKKLSRAEYDAKIAELKKKFDDTELQKKQEYDKKTLEAKQKYDELQRTQRGMSDNTTAPKPPSDPGTTAPKPGHDTGGASDDPKSAVKRAFNPAGWDEGQFWSDTDWIVGKESGWNPKAQNPSSTAYGLFQFLDETWATVGASKTDDPFKQGEAGLKYIQQRYGDPSKARSFWEANGWYDKGGIAEGAGFMAKGTLKPERILDPQQTRAFDRMVDANFEPNSPELASVGGDEFNFYITGADANEIASKVERKMRFNSMKSRGRPL